MKINPLSAFSVSFPAPSGGASARRRLAPLLSVLLLAAGAAAIGWTLQTGRQAASLLGGVNEARSAVRAAYNSQSGYGMPTGRAVTSAWRTASGLPSGWSLSGEGLRHDSGAMLAVRSRVSTFEVELQGLRPASCHLVLRSLDSGWSEVRLDGRVVAPASDGAACGWLRPVTLGLTSAG